MTGQISADKYVLGLCEEFGISDKDGKPKRDSIDTVIDSLAASKFRTSQPTDASKPLRVSVWTVPENRVWKFFKAGFRKLHDLLFGWDDGRPHIQELYDKVQQELKRDLSGTLPQEKDYKLLNDGSQYKESLQQLSRVLLGRGAKEGASKQAATSAMPQPAVPPEGTLEPMQNQYREINDKIQKLTQIPPPAQNQPSTQQIKSLDSQYKEITEGIALLRAQKKQLLEQHSEMKDEINRTGIEDLEKRAALAKESALQALWKAAWDQAKVILNQLEQQVAAFEAELRERLAQIEKTPITEEEVSRKCGGFLTQSVYSMCQAAEQLVEGFPMAKQELAGQILTPLSARVEKAKDETLAAIEKRELKMKAQAEEVTSVQQQVAKRLQEAPAHQEQQAPPPKKPEEKAPEPPPIQPAVKPTSQPPTQPEQAQIVSKEEEKQSEPPSGQQTVEPQPQQPSQSEQPPAGPEEEKKQSEPIPIQPLAEPQPQPLPQVPEPTSAQPPVVPEEEKKQSGPTPGQPTVEPTPPPPSQPPQPQVVPEKEKKPSETIPVQPPVEPQTQPSPQLEQPQVVSEEKKMTPETTLVQQTVGPPPQQSSQPQQPQQEAQPPPILRGLPIKDMPPMGAEYHRLESFKHAAPTKRRKPTRGHRPPEYTPTPQAPGFSQLVIDEYDRRQARIQAEKEQLSKAPVASKPAPAQQKKSPPPPAAPKVAPAPSASVLSRLKEPLHLQPFNWSPNEKIQRIVAEINKPTLELPTNAAFKIALTILDQNKDLQTKNLSEIFNNPSIDARKLLQIADTMIFGLTKEHLKDLEREKLKNQVVGILETAFARPGRKGLKEVGEFLASQLKANIPLKLRELYTAIQEKLPKS